MESNNRLAMDRSKVGKEAVSNDCGRKSPQKKVIEVEDEGYFLLDIKKPSKS